MCDIVIAVTRPQRHGDGLRTKDPVAATDDGEEFLQRCCRMHFAGNQPAVALTQHGALSQHGMATCIGMNDAACLVDEKQTGAEAVESIGKGCSFGDIHRPAPCPAAVAGGRRAPPIEGKIHIPLYGGERLVGVTQEAAPTYAPTPASSPTAPAIAEPVNQMSLGW